MPVWPNPESAGEWGFWGGDTWKAHNTCQLMILFNDVVHNYYILITDQLIMRSSFFHFCSCVIRGPYNVWTPVQNIGACPPPPGSCSIDAHDFVSECLQRP